MQLGHQRYAGANNESVCWGDEGMFSFSLPYVCWSSSDLVGHNGLFLYEVFIFPFFYDDRQQPDRTREKQRDLSLGCPAGEE